MKTDVTVTGDGARKAAGKRRTGLDWGYVLTHAVMFPPLFMAGIVSGLTASSRAGVAEDGARTPSIFRVAAEDARAAISTAMTDI